MISSHKRDITPGDASLTRCVDVVSHCSRRIASLCFVANTPIDHISVANDGHRATPSTDDAATPPPSRTHSSSRMYMYDPATDAVPSSPVPVGSVSLAERRQMREVEACRAALQPVMDYVALRMAQQDGPQLSASSRFSHCDDEHYELYRALGCMHRWLCAEDGPQDTPQQASLETEDAERQMRSTAPPAQESLVMMLVAPDDVTPYSYAALLGIVQHVGLLPADIFPPACIRSEIAKRRAVAAVAAAPDGSVAVEHNAVARSILDPPHVPAIPDDEPKEGDARGLQRRSSSASRASSASPRDGLDDDALSVPVRRRLQHHMLGVLRLWASALATYFLHCELLSEQDAARDADEDSRRRALAAMEVARAADEARWRAEQHTRTVESMRQLTVAEADERSALVGSERRLWATIAELVEVSAARVKVAEEHRALAEATAAQQRVAQEAAAARVREQRETEAAFERTRAQRAAAEALRGALTEMESSDEPQGRAAVRRQESSAWSALVETWEAEQLGEASRRRMAKAAADHRRRREEQEAAAMEAERQRRAAEEQQAAELQREQERKAQEAAERARRSALAEASARAQAALVRHIQALAAAEAETRADLATAELRARETVRVAQTESERVLAAQAEEAAVVEAARLIEVRAAQRRMKAAPPQRGSAPEGTTSTDHSGELALRIDALGRQTTYLCGVVNGLSQGQARLHEQALLHSQPTSPVVVAREQRTPAGPSSVHDPLLPPSPDAAYSASHHTPTPSQRNKSTPHHGLLDHSPAESPTHSRGGGGAYAAPVEATRRTYNRIAHRIRAQVNSQRTPTDEEVPSDGDTSVIRHHDDEQDAVSPPLQRWAAPTHATGGPGATGPSAAYTVPTVDEVLHYQTPLAFAKFTGGLQKQQDSADIAAGGGLTPVQGSGSIFAKARNKSTYQGGSAPQPQSTGKPLERDHQVPRSPPRSAGASSSRGGATRPLSGSPGSARRILGLGGWNMYDLGGFDGEGSSPLQQATSLNAVDSALADSHAPAWMHPRLVQQTREEHLRKLSEGTNRPLAIAAASPAQERRAGNKGAAPNRPQGTGPQAYEVLDVEAPLLDASVRELDSIRSQQVVEAHIVQEIVRVIRRRAGLAHAATLDGAVQGHRTQWAHVAAARDAAAQLLPEPCVTLDLGAACPWIGDDDLLAILRALTDAARTGTAASAAPGIGGGEVTNVAATVRTVSITRCRRVQSAAVLRALAALVPHCPRLLHVLLHPKSFDGKQGGSDASGCQQAMQDLNAAVAAKTGRESAVNRPQSAMGYHHHPTIAPPTAHEPLFNGAYELARFRCD